MSVEIKQDPANLCADRHQCAIAFIDAHSAQHLHDDQLIDRCARHIMAHFPVSRRLAIDIALHALHDVQSRERPAYVDINHSTSYVVQVIDPRSGRTVAFTASELLTLAENKADAIADLKHAVRACGRRADLT